MYLHDLALGIYATQKIYIYSEPKSMETLFKTLVSNISFLTCNYVMDATLSLA
jgi:hypothetical protein